MAFLPFTPALSLSPDVICPAYVVTYEILSVVPTLLHSPSSNPSVLGLLAVLPEPALRIGQKDRNAEGAGKVELLREHEVQTVIYHKYNSMIAVSTQLKKYIFIF